MLNRLAITSLSCVLALSAYACGGDDDDETPDAGADDGTDDGTDDGGDEPDAGDDDGVDAGADEAQITDFEGGQLLVEYITLDTDLSDGIAGGAPSVARHMGFFMGDQDPQLNTLPAISATDTCVNLYDTDGWPLGPYDGQDRAETDVGTLTLTGVDSDDQPVSTEIPLLTDSADNWLRGHDTFYQVIPPNAENFLKPDSTYTIEMSGSKDYPATTYTDAIYIGGHFELGSPGLNDEDIGLSTTSDTVITWDPPTEKNTSNQPDGLFGGLLTVVVLGDAMTGAPVMLCPVPASAGEFTITAEHVASFRESVEERNGPGTADRAILLRNYFAHNLQWYNNGDGTLPYDPANQRRIDFLGVYCYAQVVNSPE